MERWLNMSATALGRGIDAGQIDPVALAQVHLDAIAAHPLADRVYARTTPDRTLAEAAAAATRAKMGQRLSVLDGVPVSWKDLFDTAGTETEAGSALLEGRTPIADAKVLATATAMGTVCLGKTHMSELAFSGLGLNPVTATTPCVNDLDAVSGGSSSGAAGSIAFKMAPLAIGSDTGGSVRIPAAWNDLVGLKTTSGRLSLSGVVPLCARFDTIGPLARNVEDAAAALAVMEGRKPVSMTGQTLEGMRFLICDGIAFDDIRREPLDGFNTAVDRLIAQGAHVSRSKMPWTAEALGLSGALFTAEAYGTWRDIIEAAPDKMFPEILARFRSGANVSGPEFVAAWQALGCYRAEFWADAAGYDAILLPTSPILPPNIERLLTDSDYYVQENLLALRNTRIGNLMGACAVTLPTGQPSCGISLMAPPMQEDRLLQIAHAAENALA
ncbi:MAG: amidase [Planktomarina sp.]